MRAVLPVLLAVVFAARPSAQLTYERIREAAREPGSWLTYHGTYDGKRFSALTRSAARTCSSCVRCGCTRCRDGIISRPRRWYSMA